MLNISLKYSIYILYKGEINIKLTGSVMKYLNYIFDGPALGQFLGGVDPRNCKENTIGFINETCDFKPYPSICDIYFKNENSLKIPYIKSKETNIEQQIVNLHIHCKELHKFSSKTF